MVANIETIGSAFHRFLYILGFFLPISGFAGFFFTALRIKIRVELWWLIGPLIIISVNSVWKFFVCKTTSNPCALSKIAFSSKDNCLNISPKFCRQNTPRLVFLHCYIVANYCKFSNVFCAQFCNDQHFRDAQLTRVD